MRKSQPTRLTFLNRHDIMDTTEVMIMKKTLYYVSPFVLLPIVFWMIDALEKSEQLSPNVLMLLTFSLLFCSAFLFGGLSPSEKKADFLMILILPLSCFFALFAGLLLDAGCDGLPRFSIHHALNPEYYVAWLPIVMLMTVVTFLASFRPIRIRKS